jgi:hypothetical protein
VTDVIAEAEHYESGDDPDHDPNETEERAVVETLRLELRSVPLARC